MRRRCVLKSAPTSFDPLSAELDAYIRWSVKLSVTDRNGVSRRIQLLDLRKQLVKFGKPVDKVDEQLTPPEVALGAEYLINIFFELSSGRGQTMSGPAALQYSELAAYANLTGEPLEPWEVKLIKVMDNAYLSEVNDYLGKLSKETRK